MRIGGCEDWWMCGLVDVRIGGCADWWIRANCTFSFSVKKISIKIPKELTAANKYILSMIF